MNKTTLQLSTGTLERLRFLKNFKRQSYEEVLNILIDNYEEEEVLSVEEIKSIQRGLEDIRAGRTVPFEQVLKERKIVLD